MSADHDVFARMPEPPTVTPEAQDAAISRALDVYDKKYLAAPEDFLRDARLTGRTAMPPSHWRSAMPRMRYLIAACLACFVVTSSATIYFRAPSQPTYGTASVSARDRISPDAPTRTESWAQPKIVAQPSMPAG